MNQWPVFGIVCAAFVSGSAQVPQFRSVVKEVRVDVLVTDKGEPVPALTTADFEVRDNGAVQQINSLTSEELPVNVVLVLDASASVEGERLQHLRQAARLLLSALRPTDEAALIRFADTVAIGPGLTSNAAAVESALASSSEGSDTPLVDAADSALILASSSPGPRALVLVFSDGVEVSSYMARASVLETAKRSDAVVYGVTLDKSHQMFISDLADVTAGEVIRLDKVNDLDTAFARVLERFRHRYVLSFTPAPDSAPAWHRLEVRVKPRGVKVTARPGYFGG
jgi:VWFA-related protein